MWPRNGKPVIVANKIAAGLAERDGWIEDIVLYEAYVDSAQEKLAAVLRDAGLAAARVGFELGRHLRGFAEPGVIVAGTASLT